MASSKPPDDSDLLSVDALFDVLGHRTRRLILGHLAEAGGTMSVDELAEVLADTLPDDPEPSSIRLSLHHAHLPKLSDGGLVDGPDATGAVRIRWGRDVDVSLLLLDAVDRGLDRPGGPGRGTGPNEE